MQLGKLKHKLYAMKNIILILVLVAASVYSQAQTIGIISEPPRDTVLPTHVLITPKSIIYGQPDAGAIIFTITWDCKSTAIIHYSFTTYTAVTDSDDNVISHTLTVLQSGDITVNHINPATVTPGTINDFCVGEIDNYLDDVTITAK